MSFRNPLKKIWITGQAMRQFNFKVIDAEDEGAEVPVLVAGQIMIDVQNLLTDVGCLMVRRELRTQSRMPDGIADRFTLRIQGDAGGAGSKAQADGTLLEDALAELMSELDKANMASVLEDAPDGHIDAEGRRRIAADILALQTHLEGRIMMYGIGSDMRRFRVSPRRQLKEESERTVSGMQSAMVGILTRNPDKRGRWLISNGIDSIPAIPAGGVPADEAFRGVEGIPVIATGYIYLDKDGRPESIRDVIGCYPFPSVKFHRIITAEKDIPLLNPVDAEPHYDGARGLWRLTNRDLGISVSKPSWDEAVAAFHEYFVFLWEMYAEPDTEFEGEEQDVRGLLRSMAFPELL